MRPSLLLAAILLGNLACVPQPGGQCRSDGDCGFATSCERGLCRTATLPPVEVAWLEPADGAWRSSSAVSLAFMSGAPVATLIASGPKGFVEVTMIRGSDGVFRGTLDTSALADGAWTLTPRFGARSGTARALHLDRQGPQIELRIPTPAGSAFRRDETIVINATIADKGVGLDQSSLALSGLGITPIAAKRVSATEFTFTLPLSQPTLFALAGPVGLRVVARDDLGNASEQSGSVQVTRLLWASDAGHGLPVRSSPALDRSHLYVGTDGAALVALDRRTGVPVWSTPMKGPVSASPALGQLVYAASEGGDIAALEPSTGERRWACADASWRLLASPALAQTAAGETLFVSNASALQIGNTTVQGGVLAVAKAFSNGACSVLGTAGGGTSSVAVGADGTLFVGGLDKHKHALRFDHASFQELWSLPANDDVSASPSVTGTGTVLFGDDGGGISWMSPAGVQLQTAALGEKLFASPVIAFVTVLAQGRDGTLGPFVSAMTPAQPEVPAYVAQQLPAAGFVESTPAVGADGVVYIAAGRSLRAVAPGGALLWEAPMKGASTASSPALSCDGTLYVGDSSGTVMALATDSQGLAPGGWPRFRHDAHNSGNAKTPLCE